MKRPMGIPLSVWLTAATALIAIISAFVQQAEKNAENKELSKAQENARAAQEELKNYVTGGGAIPHVILIGQYDANNLSRISITLTNTFNYPIYDVTYFVRPFDGKTAQGNFSSQNLNTIPPNEVSQDYYLPNVQLINDDIWIDMNVSWAAGRYKYIAKLSKSPDAGHLDVVEQEYFYNGKKYTPRELFPSQYK